MVLHLLVGALYAVAGFIALTQPLIAALLLVGGVFRVVIAVASRFRDCG